MSFDGENIWIIGASSGIGKQLAIHLADQGARLVLSARSEDKLKELNQQLGGLHIVCPLDVSDNAQVTKAASDVTDQLDMLHRVIVLAAVYQPDDIAKMDIEFAKKTVEVNFIGMMQCALATLPIFDAQQSGQLVLCGSVAAYIGLPGGQPYSATKAAVNSFAESLHAEAPDYLDVKLICPGFVRTPMTDKNDFDMPMRIEPEQAARAIAKGLRQRGFEIHFPKRFTLLMKLLRLLPYSLSLKLTRAMKS